MLAAVLVCALPGCGGSSGSKKVSAATYVKSVCSAIGPFEKDVQSRSSALNVDAGGNISQRKKQFQDFFVAIAGDVGNAVSKLKAVGQPDVSNGKAIAAGIVNAFQQVHSTFSTGASRAAALPTSSDQAFKKAAGQLVVSVQSSVSGIGSSLGKLKSSELESAAAKDPTCKSLASGA
jgi:hypothetical protein